MFGELEEDKNDKHSQYNKNLHLYALLVNECLGNVQQNNNS